MRYFLYVQFWTWIVHIFSIYTFITFLFLDQNLKFVKSEPFVNYYLVTYSYNFYFYNIYFIQSILETTYYYHSTIKIFDNKIWKMENYTYLDTATVYRREETTKLVKCLNIILILENGIQYSSSFTYNNWKIL